MNELEIFSEALTYSDDTARHRFLTSACGDNQALRQRLDTLLSHHSSKSAVLDRRPSDLVQTLSGSEKAALSSDAAWQITVDSLRPFLGVPTRQENIGTLGHYELLSVVGQGGYGIVFKGLDIRLNRIVAIKVLLPHLAATSPARRRFLLEAKASAAVRHENVIQIYSVEELPIPYFVMEFIAGETLQAYSERLGPISPEEVVRLGRQILRGLAAAHAQGVVHRDIKPCNILIEANENPRAIISDFGLARTADDASQSQSGIVLGTPMYMSPEQVQGSEIDHRTDLFSFGSVLYLMVTGRPPFRAPTTLSILKRVADEQPRSILEIVPETPAGLVRLISRLHEKSRDFRIGTAKEAEALLDESLVWRSNIVRTIAEGFRRRTALSAVLLLGVFMMCWTILSSSMPRNSKPGTIVDSSRPAAVPKPAATLDPAPWTDWENEVHALPVAQQIVKVVDRIVELNPGVKREYVQPQISNGVVIDLMISPTGGITDLAPIRGFRNLRILRLWAGAAEYEKNEPLNLYPLVGLQLAEVEFSGIHLRDLKPLSTMPLQSVGLWAWGGSDLSPLRGLPLVAANFGGSAVTNIDALAGMPLQFLCLNHTNVADIHILQGMPLKKLEFSSTRVSDISSLAKTTAEMLVFESTQVTDLSPLRESNVREIIMDPSLEKQVETLKSMPQLKIVNHRPLDEVLREQEQLQANP